MAPTSSIAASQLHQLIYYHLDNEMLDTANFLAGRLHALEPRSADSAHLLALTYFRLRRFKAAYDYSHRNGSGGRHLGCAYIFAQACLELGRNTDGCAALEKAKALWAGRMNWKKHSETTRRHLPDAPAVYTLMAKLWRAHGDMKKAGDCYIEAHKANPFIWSAFEGLCEVGADLNLANMFRPPSDVAGAPSTTVGVPDIYTDEEPQRSHPLNSQSSFNQQTFTPTADPFGGGRTASDPNQFAIPNLKGRAMPNVPKQPLSEWDTPTGNGGVADEDDVTMGGVQIENEHVLDELPAAPVRRVRPGQQPDAPDRPRQHALRGHIQSSSEAVSAEDLRKPSHGAYKRTISGQTSQTGAMVGTDPSAPPRRSNRLFGQATTSKTSRLASDPTTSLAGKVDRTVRGAKAATGTKGRVGSTVGRVVSGNRKMMPPDPADKEKEKRAFSRASDKIAGAPTMPGVISAVAQKSHAHPLAAGPGVQAEQQAMLALLDNFRNLAVGCYATARFDLPKALQTFKSLPSAQRETPWVLAQLGKAHYEATDYRSAEDCFARLMKVQPSRIEDMEVYSTVLWHLKKENTLAFLCHTLRDQDFSMPQTWCAVGNAFSLSREHDQAIGAFKRATQLDERFAYAWTLMGHEYIANEEFDAALSAFRKSVSIDRRCYGGWYGLGKSYERMGKLEEAEKHYRIAADINPSNATLLVCVGVVLERMRNRKAALANYSKALEIAPSSALARFKKARVLMHLRHYDQALAELEVLKEQAPDEANVWFLLGKCYKGLGDKSEALKAFTSAMNLDTKAAQYIKEAIESLDDEDEDTEDD